MPNTFNPCTWESEAGKVASEFEVNVVYRASSRTARAAQRNPASEKNKTKQNNFFSKSKKTIFKWERIGNIYEEDILVITPCLVNSCNSCNSSIHEAEAR